jgi:hypothetical protein
MGSICRELDKKTQAVAGDLQIHIGTTAELHMGPVDDYAGGVHVDSSPPHTCNHSAIGLKGHCLFIHSFLQH